MVFRCEHSRLAWYPSLRFHLKAYRDVEWHSALERGAESRFQFEADVEYRVSAFDLFDSTG